jgi:hypothetical protein
VRPKVIPKPGITLWFFRMTRPPTLMAFFFGSVCDYFLP